MKRTCGEFCASALPEDTWERHYYGSRQPRTDSCALSCTDFFAGLRPTYRGVERTHQQHSHTFYVSSFAEVHVQRDGRRETMRRQHASVGACVSLIGARAAFCWRPRRSRRTHLSSSLRARTPTDVIGAVRAAPTSSDGRFRVDGSPATTTTALHRVARERRDETRRDER